MHLIYLLIATLAFGVSMLLWKVSWRKTTWYRIAWLVGACLLLPHQFFVWHLLATFRDIGGPDGGFAGMALGYMTLFSLPFTAMGFLLCFTWPRDGRLFHWSSGLVVLLTFGVWAGGSWMWHRTVGPNLSYQRPFKAVDQHGHPVVGASLRLEISTRPERVLEISELIASVEGKGSIRSSLMLTSDASGNFTSHGLRATRVDCLELAHSNCVYQPPVPYQQIKPGHIFRLQRRGAAEPLPQ